MGYSVLVPLRPNLLLLSRPLICSRCYVCVFTPGSVVEHKAFRARDPCLILALADNLYAALSSRPALLRDRKRPRSPALMRNVLISEHKAGQMGYSVLVPLRPNLLLLSRPLICSRYFAVVITPVAQWCITKFFAPETRVRFRLLQIIFYAARITSPASAG
jgi:hypothetical protein